MKKSLLAILISSIVICASCDTQKAKANDIMQNSAGTNEKSSSELPVLFVKNIEIFQKSEEFHRAKTTEDSDITESRQSFDVASVDTGVKWVNDLIYQKMLSDDFSLEDKSKEQEIRAIADPKARLQAYLAYNYDENRKNAANFETSNFEYSQTMRYIGQRQNIMSFEQYVFVDTGGAHPVAWTNYINIDAKKKAIIDLPMAFGEENLGKLKEALWQAYRAYNEENSQAPVNESEFYVNKEEFEPSADFYFTVSGVNFVYAPYAIGPYVQGEIVLSLPWEVARDLLKPEYIW